MPISFKNVNDVGFPGGPVVKTLPSNVSSMGSVPDLGAKISHGSGSKKKKNKKEENKTQNRSSVEQIQCIFLACSTSKKKTMF